jgi:hypothetical protein
LLTQGQDLDEIQREPLDFEFSKLKHALVKEDDEEVGRNPSSRSANFWANTTD